MASVGARHALFSSSDRKSALQYPTAAHCHDRRSAQRQSNSAAHGSARSDRRDCRGPAAGTFAVRTLFSRRLRVAVWRTGVHANHDHQSNRAGVADVSDRHRLRVRPPGKSEEPQWHLRDCCRFDQRPVLARVRHWRALRVALGAYNRSTHLQSVLRRRTGDHGGADPRAHSA